MEWKHNGKKLSCAEIKCEIRRYCFCWCSVGWHEGNPAWKNLCHIFPTVLYRKRL